MAFHVLFFLIPASVAFDFDTQNVKCFGKKKPPNRASLKGFSNLLLAVRNHSSVMPNLIEKLLHYFFLFYVTYFPHYLRSSVNNFLYALLIKISRVNSV